MHKGHSAPDGLPPTRAKGHSAPDGPCGHSDLTAADTRAILAGADDDTARQHLAILDLTAVLPVEQVYTLLTDPGAAENAVFGAIEHADLPHLAALTTAAHPALQTRPVTWGVLCAVLLLAADHAETAYDVARQLVDQASPLQRRAHTIRLRALRTHHPGLPGLDELIEIINPRSPHLTDRCRAWPTAPACRYSPFRGWF